MQCQTQLHATSSVFQTAAEFKAAYQKRFNTWFENIYPLESEEECLQPLEDIDNQTVERFYNNYKNSNGDPQYNLVILGVFTIDIKARLKFLTDDPGNTQMHRLVLRGQSHHRQRPKNSRFTQGSVQESLIKRKITDGWDPNWLGKTWME